MSCSCNSTSCITVPPCGQGNCERCNNRPVLRQQAALPSNPYPNSALQNAANNSLERLTSASEHALGGLIPGVSRFENRQLNYDFWQQTAEVEAQIQGAANDRNPMSTYWSLDNLIDEEKVQTLGPEYDGRSNIIQKDLAFAKLPIDTELNYWAQRFPIQPYNEHLSAFASQNGYFWDDPWDKIVYEQQFKHWQEVEGDLVHARDVQNFWMR